MRPTATAAANGGEPAPVCQPRCKVCKSPELLQKVNAMLANGFTTTAILNAIAGVNASLAPKSRITDDSLHRHRHRHFPVQAGASSVWRELMERRAEAESATFEQGVSNLLTPRIFLEAMMVKAFAGVIDGTAEISVADGARAAVELQKMTAADGGTEQMAKIVATQNRIIAAFRELPEPFQQQVLNTVEGRSAPPPGGAPLRGLPSGVTTSTDDFDPFDEGDDDDYGDDDD